MGSFLIQLLNGVTIGAQYALIAAGLALILGVAELVNFAHGEFYMMGAYLLYVLMVQLKVPYWYAAVLVVVLMALVGASFEYLVIRPLLDKPWYVWLAATLGISILLINAAILIFGAFPMNTPTVYNVRILQIGVLRVSEQRVFTLVIALAAFVGLNAFVRYTKAGKAMRAVSQNREMCAVVGINVQRVALLTFAIGEGLCGVASALTAPLLNVEPTMGTFVIMKGFAAVIMGGFGRVNGAVASAFILGIAEALIAQYITTDYVHVFSFGIMILVLVLKPAGLFGKRGAGI